MSREVASLADQFGAEVRKALGLIEATEKVRSSNPSAQVKHEFSIYRIELIYELAYLRIFVFWEQFLEESLIRYLCGYLARSPRRGESCERLYCWRDA